MQRLLIGIVIGRGIRRRTASGYEYHLSKANGVALKDRPKSLGPFATRHVYERVRSLRVGEEFTLKLSEWGSATAPTITIGNNRSFRDCIKVRELGDRKGWLISRVK
jgi:hypothetical protein